jgi:hypothetical protein
MPRTQSFISLDYFRPTQCLSFAIRKTFAASREYSAIFIDTVVQAGSSMLSSRATACSAIMSSRCHLIVTNVLRTLSHLDTPTAYATAEIKRHIAMANGRDTLAPLSFDGVTRLGL